jgi:hypothetical protein
MALQRALMSANGLALTGAPGRWRQRHSRRPGAAQANRALPTGANALLSKLQGLTDAQTLTGWR